VTFRIRKGPRYTVSAFRVVYTNAADEVPRPPRRLGLKTGSPATAETVDAAEAAGLRFLQERGYPHPLKMGRVVTRDATDRTIEVSCTVAPGPRATLGAAELRGLARVHSGYLRRRIRWAPGDPYNVKTLEDLENDLLRTGLFVSARVAASNAVDTAGNLPVLVSLAERPHRTVRAGVSYYTDEGVGAQASWENRNMFGDAEALSLTLFASQIGYGARSSLTRPDVTSRDVDLRLELDASNENPDAYDSRKARLSMLLEKRVEKTLTVTGGVAYELDRVEQQDVATHHGLVSVPLSLDWDLRDDKLDPSKGAALLLAMTPYRDVFNDLTFLKSLGEASVFARLSRSPRLVLATRAALGTITGADAADVPADKRFYAGGGGTIRGYKYQSVGELETGEPVGGNALVTVSTELRARLTRTLGAAVFVDGGTAYPGSHPDSDTPFLWGAGGGIRYYLGLAPLRVDVAFPLQRRDDIDAAFQFYVSLGQSF